ncbi:Acetyl-coenzyme A carboxylase, biotin carboxyl carrier protein subunit [Croceitalea dokdonensis DOKDO 023]|uniref:Biotin carboxyl carrier protein of acetyl-CoA carboxylase n=1 Tax=Croceitalea dokdonensis DOKDO 023 TaxID=1300341 RepID=A0A0P7AZ72_9FLAO|nr:acetyl-CoA carboxylase biotin carboxyl carrier protein [Croceitalea dokdonensis]KPM30851.1 Acetyl-coenzyme A carboxylase, biotin carboxyl carrier protein subunit [Croceitalea dokdonensis DOKDO 023]
MDIKEIQSLIKFVAKSGASEVKLEMEDIKITIRTGSSSPNPETTIVQQIPMASAPMAQAPAPAAEPVAPATPATAAEDNAKYITIKSPIIGTFYRKPAPDKPAFVEVGQEINTGDVLCVIEAMKLFNDIESEVSGKIVKILADDSSPVEFDQPLFLVDPS